MSNKLNGITSKEEPFTLNISKITTYSGATSFSSRVESFYNVRDSFSGDLGGLADFIKENKEDFIETAEFPSEVHKFLKNLGLENYFQLFKSERIEMRDLKLMKRKDLRDLGLPVGPRVRILNAIGSKTQLNKKLDLGPLKEQTENWIFSPKASSYLQLRPQVETLLDELEVLSSRRHKSPRQFKFN